MTGMDGQGRRAESGAAGEALRTLAEAVSPLDAGETARAALDRFRADKARLALPVVLEGSPVGLLTRSRLVEWLAREGGRESALVQRVTRIMTARPLILPEQTPVRLASEAIALRGESAMAEGIIVTAAGQYRGHVRASVLLGALRAAATAPAQTPPGTPDIGLIAHEIRTPLSGLLGLIGLVDSQKLDEETRKLVRTLGEQGRAMNRLLDNLIDVSRLQSDGFSLAPQDVDMGDFLREVEAVWAPNAAARRVALRVTRSPEGPGTLRLDPVRLRQIADNLIGNAIKFTREGEILVELQATRLTEGVRVRLRVADTGPGIPAELAARLFQPFARAMSGQAMREAGSGLGLSVVKGLAEAMGGQVQHMPNTPSGAVFTVEFPAETAVPARLAHDPARRRTGEFRLGRVLVAEDHPVNRMVLERALAAGGWQADLVATGQQALRRALERPYQAVLLDLRLPDMTGFEVLEGLRAEGSACASAPVLAVTADTDAQTRAKALQAGMTALIAKPIDPHALVTALADAIIDTGQPASLRLAG